VTHGELVELTLEDITVEPGAAIIGRSIRDILVEDLKGVGILGLKKPQHDFVINPRGDTVIDSGDILITTGPSEKVELLRKLSGPSR